MDTFIPFQEINFGSLTFAPTMYQEYQDGRLISSGNTICSILLKQEDEIMAYIIGNNIDEKIESTFQFDKCLTLNDRLLAVIYPRQTNIYDVYFDILRNCGIQYTRDKKDFTSFEPVVGSIYTENGIVVKMSFKLLNPERYIEFF